MSLTVASTIRDQIGQRALFMLGAHTFICGTSEGCPYLSFRVRGSKLGNVVHITLRGSDTYDVELFKAHGLTCRRISHTEGIYCDRLTEAIRQLTKLEVSL